MWPPVVVVARVGRKIAQPARNLKVAPGRGVAAGAGRYYPKVQPLYGETQMEGSVQGMQGAPGLACNKVGWPASLAEPRTGPRPGGVRRCRIEGSVSPSRVGGNERSDGVPGGMPFASAYVESLPTKRGCGRDVGVPAGREESKTHQPHRHSVRATATGRALRLVGAGVRPGGGRDCWGVRRAILALEPP